MRNNIKKTDKNYFIYKNQIKTGLKSPPLWRGPKTDEAYLTEATFRKTHIAWLPAPY